VTRSSSPGGSSTRRVSIHVVSISTGDVPLSSKIRSLSPFHHKATAARGVESEYTRACEYHIGSFDVP
jgi:hypothetical protein